MIIFLCICLHWEDVVAVTVGSVEGKVNTVFVASNNTVVEGVEVNVSVGGIVTIDEGGELTDAETVVKVVDNEVDAVVMITGVVTDVVFRGLDVDKIWVVISLSNLVVEIEDVAIVRTGVVIAIAVTDHVVTVEAVEVPKELWIC